VARQRTKATVRITKRGGFVLDKLQKLVNNWEATESGLPIDGSLRVDGHDYWWILEYGSGEFYTPPDGELTPPPGAHGGAGSGQSEWLVEPRAIRGRGRGGRKLEAGKRLKFRKVPGGPYFYPLLQIVRGQGGHVGAIRTALRRFDRMLTKDFQQLGKDGFPPFREEIAAAINARLLELLQMVKADTPVGWNTVGDTRPPDHDAGHLRDAWSVKLAR
jgi:hypothetical protein